MNTTEPKKSSIQTPPKAGITAHQASDATRRNIYMNTSHYANNNGYQTL